MLFGTLKILHPIPGGISNLGNVGTPGPQKDGSPHSAASATQTQARNCPCAQRSCSHAAQPNQKRAPSMQRARPDKGMRLAAPPLRLGPDFHLWALSGSAPPAHPTVPQHGHCMKHRGLARSTRGPGRRSLAHNARGPGKSLPAVHTSSCSEARRLMSLRTNHSIRFWFFGGLRAPSKIGELA